MPDSLGALATIHLAVWLIAVGLFSIAGLFKALAFGSFASLLFSLTSRKHVAGSLREEGDFFSAFMDHVLVFAWIKDLEGRYVYVNKLAIAHLPPFRAGWFGKTDADLWPGEIAATYRANDLIVVTTGEALETVETCLVDGQQRYLLVSKFPIFDHAGAVTLVGGTGTDITAHKRAEDALWEAEEKYRDIFENAVEGIFQTTSDGHFITANPALARMLGYDSTEELLNSRTDIARQQYVEPALRLEFNRMLERDGVMRSVEHRAYRKDGRKIWLSENVRSVCDANGAILYYEGFTEDITARKEAEEEKEQLRANESEARLQAVVMGDANLALTQDLSLERVLETLLDYLHKLVPYDSANVMLLEEDSKLVISASKGYESFLSDLTVAKANTFDANSNLLFAQICSTGRSLLIADTKQEPCWQSALVSEHVRNWIGVPLIAYGKTIGLYSLDKAQPGYFTTEHVRLAESLAASAASAIENAWLFQQSKLFRNLIDRSDDAIEVLDPVTLRFLDCNTTAHQTLGYTREEFLSLTAFDIDPFIDQPMIARVIDEMKKSGFVIFESIHQRKDGSTFPVEINAKTIRLDRDYRLAVVRDITERKRAETRSAAFANLAEKLSGAMTPLEAGQIIIQTAHDLFGWDSCTLDLYNGELDVVHPLLNVDTIDGKHVDITPCISGRVPTARGRRVLDHGPELILRKEPLEFNQDAVPFGDVSRPSAAIMTVPIRHASRVIGILSIQSYCPLVYDDVAMRDLHALADHCGEALNRIQAEEQLRDSEERYRDIVENSREFIGTHDLDGLILSANRAATEILGHDRDYFGKKNLREILTPAALEGFDDYIARIRKDGVASGIMLVQTSSGERRVWEYYNTLRTEGVATPVVRGMARDITERKRAEKERDRLFNLSLDPLCVAGFDGYFKQVNPAWTQTLGWSEAELLNRPWLEFVHPEDREATVKAGAALAANQSVLGFENRYQHKDGSYRWFSWNSFPLSEARLIVAVVRDVTERKQGENALKESEERFRQLSEAAFEAIILHDQGTILEVNQSFCQMYGYERAEVIGKSVLDLAPPEFRELLLQRVRSGYTDPYEGLALRKDGSIFRAEVAGKPIHYQGGVVRVAAIRDITEQKRNERRQAAQYAVTRVLAEAATLAEATPQLLQVICESLRWKMGEFWRVCDSTNLLRWVETWHVPELDATSFIEASRQAELAPGTGLPGRVWQSGQPAWIPDLMTDPSVARAPIAARLGLRGSVAFPIMLGNHTLGVMLFFSRRSPEVDEDLLKIMSAIGSQIGQFTKRKRAEEALRESEERYRDLVENSHEFICTHDLDGKILSANRVAVQLLGYDPKELIGKRNIRDILAPQVRDQFDDYMAQILKKGATSGMMLVQTSSGEHRVWEYYNSLRTEGVKAPIVRGIARDVTEERRAEKVVSDLRHELELTMNSMEEGVYRVDLTRNIVFENPAAARMLGWEVAELLGKPAHLTMHHTRPDGTPYPMEECPIYDTLRDGITRQVTNEVFWRRDGTSFPVEYMTAPMRNDRNEIVATVVTFRDITERKRAEEALRESEERYRELFENAKDTIYVHDLNGIYTSVNRAAEQLTGYSREEIIGKHFSDFLAPEYLPRVRNHLGKKLTEQRPTSFEVEVIARDGRRVPVELSGNLVCEDGVPVGVQGIARDITERKRAAELLQTFPRRLIEAQEAERKRIARELHDEIGQVLTAVTLNLQTVRASGLSPTSIPNIDESILVVDDALHRVRNLALELRPSLLDDLGLAAAIRWFVDCFAQRTGIKTEVVTDRQDAEGRLSRELETACFRIVQEALTNVTRHAEAKTVYISLVSSGAETCISIKDDGVGFDVHAGNGAAAQFRLGLRGMEERALALAGKLEIKSAPSRGTEIRAYFPNEKNGE